MIWPVFCFRNTDLSPSRMTCIFYSTLKFVLSPIFFRSWAFADVRSPVHWQVFGVVSRPQSIEHALSSVTYVIAFVHWNLDVEFSILFRFSWRLMAREAAPWHFECWYSLPGYHPASLVTFSLIIMSCSCRGHRLVDCWGGGGCRSSQ